MSLTEILRQFLTNMQNVRTILNLFMRKYLKMLILEANVNGMKMVKSQLNFFLTQKKRSVKVLVRKLEVNGKEICDQAKINDEIKMFF